MGTKIKKNKINFNRKMAHIEFFRGKKIGECPLFVVRGPLLMNFRTLNLDPITPFSRPKRTI